MMLRLESRILRKKMIDQIENDLSGYSKTDIRVYSRENIEKAVEDVYTNYENGYSRA